MIKRIYVTPKDIALGGPWNGWGKDAISRAMTRTLGKKTTVGGTIFVTDYLMGDLPRHITQKLVATGMDKPITGPRFNFRVEL